MSLKRTLLEALQTEQLKHLCAELAVQSAKRSRDALLEVLSSSARVRPEKIVALLTIKQLREALEGLGKATAGNRNDLVKRLLNGNPQYDDISPSPAMEAKEGAVGTYAAPSARSRAAQDIASDGTAQYRHQEQAIQRPDAGIQDQFLTRKPGRTYRYDSSLDPALSWDEQRERDLGEWLLDLVVQAATHGEKAVFSSPQEWRGGGV